MMASEINEFLAGIYSNLKSLSEMEYENAITLQASVRAAMDTVPGFREAYSSYREDQLANEIRLDLSKKTLLIDGLIQRLLDQ